MMKKIFSWLLVWSMVLGMIPADAMVANAAELPGGAPFTEISTDAGEVTGEIEDRGTVDFTGYNTYEGVPYYHVAIPEDATEVYVTFSFEEDPFADADYGSAYGYVAETEGWTGTGAGFAFEEVADGYKVTFPLTMDSYDPATYTPIEACFAEDEDGNTPYAVALERNDYSPIAFFTFVYVSGDAEVTEEPIPTPAPPTPTVTEEVKYFEAIRVGDQQIADEKISYKGMFSLGDAPEGDDDGYVYIHEVPYYIVEVPLGTENVEIIYAENTDILNAGSDAFGYRTVIDEEVDAVSSATVKSTTFKNGYTRNADGTQSVITSAKNHSVDADGMRWAVTLEESESPFEAVCLFSFNYPEHNHNYTSIVTEPTCTKGGYTTHTCSDCFLTYKDSETESSGHDYNTEVIEATCEKVGYTIYTCKMGDHSYTGDIVEKKGHTKDENIEPVVVDATCEKDGSITYACAACGKPYVEVIESQGHDETTTEIPATCMEPGYTLHGCNNCNYEFKDNYTELADHNYENGECTECGAPIIENGVYQIGTESQLRWFEAFVESGITSANAKLIDNITILGNTEAWDGIGTSQYRFAGSFDGDGNTITIENGSNGLFAYVQGTSAKRAEVKNITFDGSISNASANNVAGIAGFAGYANITNCINKASVTGNNYTAGVVGNTYVLDKPPYATANITISDCGNEGAINGKQYVAGILSYAKGSAKVLNCYNAGMVKASGSEAGGIAGYLQGYQGSTNVTNCYNTAAVKGSGKTGGLIGNLFNDTTLSNCYNIGESTYAIAGALYNKTAKVKNTYFLASTSEAATPANYSYSSAGAVDKTLVVTEGKTSQDFSSTELAELLGEAYQASCPSPVFTTQTAAEHQLNNGVCESCNFGSTEKEIYTVTIPKNATGFVVTGEETAVQGESYTFRFNLKKGFKKGKDFKVSVSGHELIDNGDGSYTVETVTSNMEIFVVGVEVAEYQVTLPKSGNGYAVTPVNDGKSPVMEGNSYQFVVEIKDNFTTDATFEVKANDVVLQPVDGVFTIENITSDQNITVTGVVMIPYEETVSVRLSISEGTEKFFESDITDQILIFKELDVPYFDLSLYGLEKFYYNPYCYMDENGNIVRQSAGTKETAYGKITAMHAFIYATEVIYLDYDEEDAGCGLSYNTMIEVEDDEGNPMIVNQFVHAINWTQDAGSSFMDLWGFGTNLNYYVNYTYPLGKPGWGSTSDQIVLKDGDCISAHLIVADKGSASGSNFPFFIVNDTNGTFDITEQDYKLTVTVLDTVDIATVERGEKLNLTLYIANPGEGYTTAYTKQQGKVLYMIEEENLIANVVGEESGWNPTNYVTDENGMVTIDTSELSAGVYYIGAEGGMTEGGQDLGDGFVSKGGETGVAALKLIVTENQVTPSVTPTVTEEPSVTPTVTPTVTEEPSVTPTVTEEPSVTPNVTEAPQPTETEVPQPTETPETTVTPEATGTPEVTETPEATGTPEVTETPEATETPGATEEVTTVFDDVHKDWYTDYVQYVYDNGLMTGIKGTTKFQPDANITKAQVAQVLYNMEGQPKVEDKAVFTELTDVYAAEWYADAVAWAFETGVVTGDTNAKKFFPNADVTREQLALMMYRYAKFKGYNVEATSDFAGFVNADKVNNWAAEGMSWAVGSGLITGIEKDGVKDLAPQGNATRAQMAAILQRFCESYQ